MITQPIFTCKHFTTFFAVHPNRLLKAAILSTYIGASRPGRLSRRCWTAARVPVQVRLQPCNPLGRAASRSCVLQLHKTVKNPTWILLVSCMHQPPQSFINRADAVFLCHVSSSCTCARIEISSRCLPVYITSVDDSESSNRAPTPPVQRTPPPSPEQLKQQQQHPQPIPSIDLTMALSDKYGVGGSYDDNGGSADEMQQINATRLTSPGTGMSSRESSIKGHNGAGCAKGWANWSQPLTLLAVFVLLWGVAYSILPRELTDPDTPMMRLCFLFIGAQVAGVLCTLVGLPDMLGMLFWGVLYTNVGLADFKGLLRVEAFLRDMSLINIMLLAGLGLDYDALKKLFRIIMQLTLIPTAAEVVAITVLSHYLLDLPWLWGVLLGLVITAISPNVVVTVMLRLAEQGLGKSKGIRTMILATTSCNDVLAIFLFGVILGVIFSTGNLTSQILQGPIGIVIGLVFGGACGLLLLYLPSYQAKYTNGLRFTVTILAGTLAVVGSRLVGYPSAGALGCIMTSFVAGTGWKRRLDYDTNEVGAYLDLLWKFLKPVSFSLIGKEVNFDVLEGSMVLYGTITLLVAVVFRLVFSYFSTLGSDLNWKEKAYVTLSGFPKATVQAALGPAALDLARSLNATDELERAQTVLIVTVVAIILTAPLGALLMVKLAPKWLKKDPVGEGGVV